MSEAGLPARVLHVITTLDRGGAENGLLHLCRGMRERVPGTALAVAYLKGDGELAPEFMAAGVAVHDLALRGARGVGAYGRARRLVGRLRPDVVHTHLFKADCLGAAAVATRAGRSARLVSTKHNEDMYFHGSGPRPATWRAVGRRVAKRADAVIAISEGVARFVREHLGDAPRDLLTIPYGLPALDRAGDGAAFRAEHAIGGDDCVLLCVARLDEQKDHATLFDAFERCAPGARLVLLGRGPLEEALRERAPNNVVFAGFVDDPADAYAAADVLVLSSRHEGLGLVILEAAQHGVPAVATRVGGIPDVVQDGKTGLLVPPGDAAELSTALDRLIASPDERRRLGDAARTIVETQRGVERYVDEHLTFYARLIGVTP